MLNVRLIIHKSVIRTIVLLIITMPVILTSFAIDNELPEDLKEQLAKRYKDGQYGLEVGISYEIEMADSVIGAYVENFNNETYQKKLTEFLTRLLDTDTSFRSEMKKSIIKNYPTRENLRVIREKHHDAFKDLTKGLNQEEVSSWLDGHSTQIHTSDMDMNRVFKDLGLDMGDDPHNADKFVLGRGEKTALEAAPKPKLFDANGMPIGTKNIKADRFITTDSGLFVPGHEFVDATGEKAIKTPSTDISSEIKRLWMDYPTKKRNHLIEFDQLRRESRGYIVKLYKREPLFLDLKKDAPEWTRNTNSAHLMTCFPSTDFISTSPQKTILLTSLRNFYCAIRILFW